jgi:hypothetical protein
MTRLSKLLVEIRPFWIDLFDQTNLPGAVPLFDSLLPINRVTDIVKGLDVNHVMDVVSSGKAPNETFAVLVSASHDIVRHTRVEHAIRAAGEDVDIITQLSFPAEQPRPWLLG